MTIFVTQPSAPASAINFHKTTRLRNTFIPIRISTQQMHDSLANYRPHSVV